jgi:LacI family transcriptional regulator
LRKAGIPVQIELTREGDFTFESGRVAAKQILDLQNRPTAIVASNDDMASGVVWVAQQRRMEIPGDLSVAGFDDTPTALKSWPPLTVIRHRQDGRARCLFAVGLIANAYDVGATRCRF